MPSPIGLPLHNGTPRRSRTYTELFLRQVPLPVGLEGHKILVEPVGLEPTTRSLQGLVAPMEHVAPRLVLRLGVEPSHTRM